MGAENQAKSATTNDPKKRKRSYLPHNKPVKKKGYNPLRPGFQGFFITCDGGREHQASQEAINVIDTILEELIDGKDSDSNPAAKPEKPANKKIKFTYSDSSDNDEDDDENEKDNQSEKVAEEGTNNGSSVEENTDPAKKDDQLVEIGSGQVAGDVGEVAKLADEDKSKEKEELHGVGSGQVAGDDEEVAKLEDGKSKENEEPLEKKQCCDTKKLESNHQNAEMSVDRLIEAELKELGDKSKRRFSKIDTGCNGVVIVQMRKRDGDPSPGEIGQHLMESASRTKKHMSRFLLRVLPVEVSCYSSEEEISRAIKPLIEQYFPVNSGTPVKFAVQYDARANSGIERMKIIDAVAKSVPEPHKVDLKNPDKTIIVQIVKTVCLIGVVEKYKELSKFNLRQLTSP
ncbi:hypothetical protein SOVF_031070 [Spinacia oleracea]|uniref:THUMP domain-containing protein n=1 Tax=Spinacia oleracea TaxID=3562 RepID=A0A9R0JQW2_SPIOL|nr:uncharacterized protein LOC110783285 [Spinacia oleracea]KNA22616.1 hypothetical protein SOVF_031070 [Spinacia oleracea]